MTPRSLYSGIFLLSAAIIIFELTMTRLLSVTLYYHMAFMVISIVMLGISLGAMLVYCKNQSFPQDLIGKSLNVYCTWFAVLAPISAIAHVLMPLRSSAKIQYGIWILITCALFCLSFVFAGVCTCLVLTRFPDMTSKLYAADLAGAAAGCYLFVLTLGPLDGVSETLLVGTVGCLAAWCFAERLSKERSWALAGAGLFLCVALLNSYCVNSTNSGLRISWMHGSFRGKPLFERWSVLGRVTVTGDPPGTKIYHTPGYSNSGPLAAVQGLNIDIDGSARTSMLGYADKPQDVQFLKHDVVYLAHHIRKNADVLILGSGGGKDVVAALASGQHSVTGIELNGNILQIANQKYGDLTGHLNHLNNVTFVNDEARSYIFRSSSKYDIIQQSLIDTWAATASGAYVLSENCLYTVEAWSDFLKHLKPGGIFTVSRWYRGNPPAEFLRTLSLASAALHHIGIDSPQNHIIAVKNGPETLATCNLLISPTAFSDADVKLVKKICRDMHFDYIFGKDMVPTQSFLDVVNQKKTLASNSFNYAAPTDDSPFFFNMVKLDQMFSLQTKSGMDANWQAVYILFASMIVAAYGSLLLIILPLRIAKVKLDQGALTLGFYFLAIGFGFMFIEISQIQTLIVFLGHPSYGVTCVLFTLLLSAGLGSLCLEYLTRLIAAPERLLICQVVCLALFGLSINYVFPEFRYAPAYIRIALSCLILSAPGFCLGFAFPLGMRLVSKNYQSLGPWFWGLNGAGSVCGSIAGIWISMSCGITNLFLIGVACYVAALVAYHFSAAKCSIKEPRILV